MDIDDIGSDFTDDSESIDGASLDDTALDSFVEGDDEDSADEENDSLSQLGNILGKNSQAISKTLGLLTGRSLGSKNSQLQKLAASSFSGIISTIMGGNGTKNSQQPIDISMNSSSSEPNFLRMSSGQTLAEMASAISRASRRYL